MSIRRGSMASIHGNLILERVLHDNSGLPPAPGIGKHLSLDSEIGQRVHVPAAAGHPELERQDSFCLTRVVKSNINFQMLPYKLFYLFTDGAMACVVPYRSLFFKQLGLSPYRIGIISASKPFASFIANPLAGVFADRFGKRRLIMAVSILIWITLMVGLGFVPQPLNECRTDLVDFSCVDGKKSHVKRRSVNSRVYDPGMFSNHDQRMNYSRLHLFLINIRNIDTSSSYNSNLINGTSNKPHNDIADHPSDIGKPTFEVFGNIRKLRRPNKTKRDSQRNKSQAGPRNSTSDSVPPPAFPAVGLTGDAAASNGTDLLSTYSEECLLANQCWRYNKESLDSTFITILVITCLTYCAFGPGMRLADTSTLNTLSHSSAKDITDYGWHRSFGGLGWAVCSLSVGSILSIYNTESVFCGVPLEITDYRIAFLMFGGVAFLAFVCSFWMDFGKATGHEWNTQWAELSRLFCNPHYASVLCVAFFVGICNGCTWGFLLWHLQNLGASQFLIGLLEALQSSSELVIGFFCHSILQRLGHVYTLCIGLFLYAIRFACYALIVNPYWMIPVEIAHGVSFLMTWTTLVSYLASAVSAEGLATAQGILGAFYFGLGNGLGSFSSGLLIDRFGAGTTFSSFSVACAVALILFFFIQKMCPQSGVDEREERRRQKDTPIPPSLTVSPPENEGAHIFTQPTSRRIVTHVTLEDIPNSGSHSSSDSGVDSLQPKQTYELGNGTAIPDLPRSPRRAGHRTWLYIPYMDSISTDV